MKTKTSSTFSIVNMDLKTLLLTLAFFGSLSAVPVPTPEPYHSFCKTMWLFSMNCSDVVLMLWKQIQAWSPEEGCEMCLYSLLSVTAQYITASHSSPDGLQNISMSFLSTRRPHGCRVSAVSQSSQFSPSLLDNGVNYCNLHDLVAGSGLSFLEMTNEWVCLSYNLATCSV